MHELSIAMSILDIANEQAQRHENARVAAVHVRLGTLSGVVKEALLAAYDMASQTCGISDSRLVIEEIPVTIYCPACQGARSIVSMQDFRCCQCGTPSSDVVTGRELEVTAVEIIS